MDIRLGRMVILVDDYDKAFDFYSANFSCRKIYDSTTEDGSRYLHVVFNENDTTGIWFLLADTTDQKTKLGKQTPGQPTIVLYTDQSEKLYNRLVSKGNRITVVELIQSQ